METTFHFQLSAESPEKFLLKCHLAILLRNNKEKLRTLNFPKELKLEVKKNEVIYFCLEQSFSPEFEGDCLSL